jgi:prepilin-type N-terminal cleavage/methylation domain-containing protein
MKFYKKSGFTLIELLVTIAIIGILSTLAVVAVQAARDKAKIAKASQEVDQLVTAIRLLENDTGQWPGHQQIDVMTEGMTPEGADNEICSDGCSCSIDDGCAGLTQDDSGTPYSYWNGPYIVNIPEDPWGNEYFFDTDYDHPAQGWSAVIGSYGPNGEGNNAYDDDDIVKIIY